MQPSYLTRRNRIPYKIIDFRIHGLLVSMETVQDQEKGTHTHS